jgi:hypothetical protein
MSRKPKVTTRKGARPSRAAPVQFTVVYSFAEGQCRPGGVSDAALNYAPEVKDILERNCRKHAASVDAGELAVKVVAQYTAGTFPHDHLPRIDKELGDRVGRWISTGGRPTGATFEVVGDEGRSAIEMQFPALSGKPTPPPLTDPGKGPKLRDVPEKDKRTRRDKAKQQTPPPPDQGLDTPMFPDRPGEPRARLRIRAPQALAVIRARMEEARAASNLTLAEVGERMGPGIKNPAALVWQLMNTSPDPPLLVLLRFCRAVGVSLDAIVPPDIDPTR